MTKLEEKIQSIVSKELQHANDYIAFALESTNPIAELTKLVYKYAEIVINEKTKLETIQSAVSEQYFK